MNKTMAGVIIVAGLAVAGYYAGPWLMKPSAASASSQSAEITYLCRESGKLVRGPRDAAPATADCPTPVQALYCPACQGWYPYPPPAAIERMPQGPVCPKHHSGLVEEVPAAGPPKIP